MGELGQVTEVNDDLLKIRMENTARCEGCTCNLSRGGYRFLSAKNMCAATEDDWVRVEIRSNTFFNAVLIVYGVPFIGLIVGFFLGYLMTAHIGGGTQEVVGFITGIVTAGIAFFCVRIIERRLDPALYTPIAVALAEKPEEKSGPCSKYV